MINELSHVLGNIVIPVTVGTGIFMMGYMVFRWLFLWELKNEDPEFWQVHPFLKRRFTEAGYKDRRAVMLEWDIVKIMNERRGVPGHKYAGIALFFFVLMAAGMAVTSVIFLFFFVAS